MTRVDELNRLALKALDAQAKNLETEFSTFEEFQDLCNTSNNRNTLEDVLNLRKSDRKLEFSVKTVPRFADCNHRDKTQLMSVFLRFKDLTHF